MRIALHYFLAILAPTVPIIQNVNVTGSLHNYPWLPNSPWCRNYLLHLLVLSPVFQTSQIKQQGPKYTSERSDELSSIHNIHLGLNSRYHRFNVHRQCEKHLTAPSEHIRAYPWNWMEISTKYNFEGNRSVSSGKTKIAMTTIECGVNLINVTHKVSDQHLHHQ